MSKPVVLLDAGELVTLPGTNDGDVLSWDEATGSWVSSPGGGVGTVTSVALSTGSTGLTVSGGTSQTITGSGTFTLSGTLGAGFGGTGLGAPVSGDAGKVLTATSGGGYELATPAATGVTSITVGAGLDGGTITDVGTISMPNVGTARTDYGSASKTVTLTTDAQGRVTALSEQSIAGLNADVIATGTLPLARGGTGIDGSTVSAAEILVGQVGGGAVDFVGMSKDATLGADGALTVTGWQGRPVSSAAPIAGQSMVWSAAGGGSWVPGDTASGGSGGGGVVYFMNAGTSRTGGGLPIGTYQLGRTAEVSSSPITVTNVATGGWTRVAGFVSDAGDPSIVTLPAGVWDFNTYATSTANANDMTFRLSFYAYDGSTDPELGSAIATTLSTAIYDPSVAVQYQSTFNIGPTAFTGKRLYIKLEVQAAANNKNATFDFGDSFASHVHTTVPSVTGSGFVKVLNDVIMSTGQSVDLASVADVGSSVLGVVNGGTGAATLPEHEVLVGNGTGAVSSIAMGTNGALLIGGTNGPSAQTLTAGTGVGVANGDHAITISIGQAVATTDSPTFAGLTLSGLTGYLKGNGSSALSASSSIPATDISGLSGTYAPLASPTFTGTPSLPTGTTGVTQASGDSSTKVSTTAFVAAAVAAAAGTPYDLPLEIPGTPSLSTKVVNFSSVRAFILSTTGHQGGQLTNPSGNFVCTVRKNATTLGTITFASGGFSSSITATLSDRTFAAGDVLSVETPASALGIDTPFATLLMTLV